MLIIRWIEIRARDDILKPKVYETTIQLPHFLGDRYRVVTLPHLMSALIEVSGAQTLKVASQSVEDLGLNWIIIQYDIQINRMPKVFEAIRVKTYAKEFNRIFSYREFEVYDENDELLVYVMTVFALMDENRKLSKIPSFIGKDYGSTESRRIKRIPKPASPENLEKANLTKYQVSYFDIDTNFHANNSTYFVWMLDALGDEFLATHEPVTGNVTFDKEVHIGETVESYIDFTVDENDQIISRHQIRVGTVSKCVGTFQWKEKGIDYQINEPTEA